MKKKALVNWGLSHLITNKHCNSLVFYSAQWLHPDHISALLFPLKPNKGQLVSLQWHDTHNTFYENLNLISNVVRINTRKNIRTEEHKQQG